MAKIILTVDGTILKEVLLTKERITIGRRSHNDLVIDHAAISAEHAVLITLRGDSFLEDLNSTNGTQVNGQPVKKYVLQDNDIIELTPYKIRFIAGDGTERASGDPQGAAEQCREDDPFAGTPASDGDVALQQHALIRVLNGPFAGKELSIAKPLTTIGRPGVQVALVTHRTPDYFITHVEGSSFPLVNGNSIGANARLLKVDDVIDLSGTRMVFKRVEL
jgi:hypothetical protein